MVFGKPMIWTGYTVKFANVRSATRSLCHSLSIVPNQTNTAIDLPSCSTIVDETHDPTYVSYQICESKLSEHQFELLGSRLKKWNLLLGKWSMLTVFVELLQLTSSK